MLKLGKLKNPHHDAAAADVLAAFEAAQGGGLPTVECYHAAVGAWRRAHPDHTATYAAQQAVRIVLEPTGGRALDFMQFLARPSSR
jgi:hypothetical protein